MEKPDFNRVYDVFIPIGLPQEIRLRKLIDMIRFEIYPLISYLKKSKMINWYFFLIHNRETGSIPTTEDDRNLYYHLRFGLEKNINPEDFLQSIEDRLRFKPLWRTTKNPAISIGRNKPMHKNILKNEEYEEAWKIMGEQSEWIINMLNAHKDDIEISEKEYYEHILQFMHYYFNMLALLIPIICPNCKTLLTVTCPKCQTMFSRVKV
jgi:hypothetical protein